MGDKIRVGITGQAGFIGSHLYNYLGLFDTIERIPFQDEYFQDDSRLRQFAASCDAIVHLAAVNRHADPESLAGINIRLVRQLIQAMEAADATPHLLFSSSIQERRDNPYGRSKKAGRQLLMEWAAKHHAAFTGLVIPNVFGPFGRPFYNSVIATFSHQLVNDQEPKIEIDAELPLIYVNDLAAAIWRVIEKQETAQELEIKETATAKVTDLLARLADFKKNYMTEGFIPDLSDYFDLCLFNTFRSYLPHDFFPRQYTLHADNRGHFVELVKTPNGGQTSFSTTRPGITRGNHFHTRKVERFMVIKGQAEIRLRRIGTDQVITYQLTGDQPAFVDIPVWYTHNITNTGPEDLYTVFWINELYNPDDPDTFFENV